TGKQLSRLGGPTDEVRGMAFSADARTLFAWSKDRDLHSWDVSTSKHLRRPCARFEWSPHGVVFSPDCQFVAVWSSVAYIRVVDVATGREIRRLTNPSDAHDQTVTCVAFSPDGRTLAWA